MARRLILPILFLSASLAQGAVHRTQNFTVEAATPQIAEQVGKYAEHYRKEKAMLWLGREMPPWPQPCPLKVSVTMGGSGGATSFAFDRGQVLGQHMHIEGTLERLLSSVLPHEVTHTVFAFHFRQPVPRWADEGGSVLSEDDLERRRHDKLVRQVLNTGRAMPLRRLFSLKEYPRDVMVLYAQGFSVTEFLVSKSSRPAFLNFLADGMRAGWDQAAQAHYGYRSVDELEQAWLQHLRDTKERPPTEVARGGGEGWKPAQSQEVVVRQTVPPAQPLDNVGAATYRGAAPRYDDEPARPFRQTSLPPVPALPPIPAPTPGATLGAPVVTLGPPEFAPAPATIGTPAPGYPE